MNKAQGQAVAFDLETRGTEHQWTDPVGEHVKLGSFIIGTDAAKVTTGGAALRVGPDHTLLDILNVAGLIAGHNIMAYDLIVLHRHYGFATPWELVAAGRRLHDTQLSEALIDPPEARLMAGEAARRYKLEEVAQRRGYPQGKVLDLAKVAKHYGGYELIPWDDERQNVDLLAYARQDAELVRRLVRDQYDRRNPYLVREHALAAIAAQMTINGFAVDELLLSQRVREGREKRAQILDRLRAEYGLPETDSRGHVYKSPQSTKAGKAAILAAFVDLGMSADTFPHKERSGAPNLSKETMAFIIEHGTAEQAELAETIMTLNGIRSTMEQVLHNLADGRVHPSIEMRQASGRWSFTKPGLTVMGKRAGRVRDREVFIAEPGYVMLSADLSQVDARAVAAHSQDPAYMELFAPGRDVWDEMAAMFGISRDEVKVIGHGSNYGMGVKGTKKHNPHIPMEAIIAFHEGRRRQFPRLMAWQEEVRERAGAGELLDNGFGRKLRCNPDRAYTQGPALMGQAAARDIMCQGLLNLCRAYPESLPWLRAMIHDEVVLAVPAEAAEDAKRMVEKSLSFDWAPPGASRPIQIRAEATIGGRTWASTYGK